MIERFNDDARGAIEGPWEVCSRARLRSSIWARRSTGLDTWPPENRKQFAGQMSNPFGASKIA